MASFQSHDPLEYYESLRQRYPGFRTVERWLLDFMRNLLCRVKFQPKWGYFIGLPMLMHWLEYSLGMPFLEKFFTEYKKDRIRNCRCPTCPKTRLEYLSHFILYGYGPMATADHKAALNFLASPYNSKESRYPQNIPYLLEHTCMPIKGVSLTTTELTNHTMCYSKTLRLKSSRSNISIGLSVYTASRTLPNRPFMNFTTS